MLRAVYMRVSCRIPLVTSKGRLLFSYPLTASLTISTPGQIKGFAFFCCSWNQNYEAFWKSVETLTTWGPVEIITGSLTRFRFWWRVNQIWFLFLVRYTLFTEKKMVGLGVGCWILILSRQQLSVGGATTDGHSSAHWNTVCLTQYQV